MTQPSPPWVISVGNWPCERGMRAVLVAGPNVRDEPLLGRHPRGLWQAATLPDARYHQAWTRFPTSRRSNARIPGWPSAEALLGIFEQDEKTLHHIYRKWKGPHWSLACLALIDYPPGDAALRPLVHRVYDWLSPGTSWSRP